MKIQLTKAQARTVAGLLDEMDLFWRSSLVVSDFLGVADWAPTVLCVADLGRVDEPGGHDWMMALIDDLLRRLERVGGRVAMAAHENILTGRIRWLRRH